MQPNYRFDISTFGNWMPKFRKIGKLKKKFNSLSIIANFEYEFISILFQNVALKQTLSHCELITDDGIRQLAAGSCAAESLSVLELDNCPLITDQTLEHLVSCHNLQRIELYDCQMITRGAIRRLRVRKRLIFTFFSLIFNYLQKKYVLPILAIPKIESFTKYKGTRLLCTCDPTTNHIGCTAQVLSLLWDFVRRGGWSSQKNTVSKSWAKRWKFINIFLSFFCLHCLNSFLFVTLNMFVPNFAWNLFLIHIKYNSIVQIAAGS